MTILRRGSCYQFEQLQQTPMDERTILWRRVIWPCEIKRLLLGQYFPYLDRPAFPCKFSLLVLHFICISLRLVCTSVRILFSFESAIGQYMLTIICLNASVSSVSHSHRMTSTILRCQFFFENQNANAWFGFLISEGSIKDA